MVCMCVNCVDNALVDVNCSLSMRVPCQTAPQSTSEPGDCTVGIHHNMHVLVCIGTCACACAALMSPALLHFSLYGNSMQTDCMMWWWLRFV